MDIKKLYKFHKKIAPLRSSYLLILAILFMALAVYALRQNNFTMIRLRDDVVKADQQNGDVEKALRKLREHVYNHMNTNLASGEFSIKPPIQLKARYDRLVASEQERTKAASADLTKKAEAVCAQQFPGGGFNAPRVACIQEYVGRNAVKPGGVPDELYKFDFISPKWSPDLAGLSLVASGLFFLLFISRFVLERWLRKRLD